MPFSIVRIEACVLSPNSVHITTTLLAFWLFFFQVVRPPLFGLGRSPITPPGPAMALMDRKDLNPKHTHITTEMIVSKHVFAHLNQGVVNFHLSVRMVAFFCPK